MWNDDVLARLIDAVQLFRQEVLRELVREVALERARSRHRDANAHVANAHREIGYLCLAPVGDGHLSSLEQDAELTLQHFTAARAMH